MKDEEVDPIEQALSKAKLQVIEEDYSDFGTYIWVKENGKA